MSQEKGKPKGSLTPKVKKVITLKSLSNKDKSHKNQNQLKITIKGKIYDPKAKPKLPSKTRIKSGNFWAYKKGCRDVKISQDHPKSVLDESLKEVAHQWRKGGNPAPNQDALGTYTAAKTETRSTRISNGASI